MKTLTKSQFSKLAVILVGALFLVGCTANSGNSNGTGSTSSSNGVQGTTTASSGKTFTMEEVAKSNSRTDCKTVINGKVYDVTSYIGSHPGGNEILAACGIDATALFTGTDPQGRDHTSVAERTLERYYVGELAE